MNKFDLRLGGIAEVDVPPDPPQGDRREVALLRVVERHVLPRLAMRAPALIRPSRFGDGLSEEVDGLTDLALDSDTEQSHRVLHRLYEAGASFNDLQLGLLVPATRRLDRMWLDDEVSFLDVTLAAGNLQQMMRFVALDLAAPARACSIERTIIIAPAPGEQHVFGAAMAAEFFRHHGWNTVFEPRPTEAGLVDLASRTWFDVFGLSISSGHDPRALHDTISAVRDASLNPDLMVIAGGEALVAHPAMVGEIGADATLAALEAAPARVHSLVEALFGAPARRSAGA